ncbi:MAG: DUF721 domain-containing protein [Bacteroidales bacterium]|jgi:hypothetical protein|nr:DUF721 domain-containing protein [Bacteroidales bacterium]
MNNTEEIGNVIKNMLKELRLEDKYLQARIHSAWKDISGEYLYRHTTKVKFQNECLYLYINSAAIKNELQYSKTIIIEQINKEIGEEAVKFIKIF